MSVPPAVLSCPQLKRSGQNERGGWDDFFGTVEVTMTTPLLFWPLPQLGEREFSYRLTRDH
jgi:hypothetical protein